MGYILKEKKVKLDKVNYKIKELLASERTLLLSQTTELLGESTAAAIKAFILDSEQALALGEIITGLYKKATPQELTEFLEETIRGSVITPNIDGDNFEYHFAEHYHHMPALLKEIYEQNFGKAIEIIKKKLFSLGILTPKSSQENQEEEQKQPKSKSKPPLVSTNFSNTK
jgi:hypothetical protein